MSYNFELIGITPVLTFFNYQQTVGTNPQRSKAYLGSYQCSLDALIASTQMIPEKPAWDWDEVVETMIKFWLNHEDTIKEYKLKFNHAQNDNLIVARITNFEALRHEFEQLLDS